MKRPILLFIVAALTITSCNHQEPKSQTASGMSQQKIDPKQEFAKLNAFLKKYDTSQTFNVATNKPIKVIGKQGTIIHINPADLQTEDGNPVGKTVDIELKELTNQSQLLMANAQTVSNGNLLVSGGAYYINVTSDGQKVKLKDGKTYSVDFVKLSDDEMGLYYGRRDSLGNINWQQAGQNFKNKTEKLKKDTIKNYKATIVNQLTRRDKTWDTSGMKKEFNKAIEAQNKEEMKSIKYYYPVVLTQFGLINCDRFFNPNARKTDIYYTITNKPGELNYIKVHLIFKDINSIMSSDCSLEKISGSGFGGVPIGQSVEFLAVAYQNQKIYAALTDVMPVTANLNEKLTLQEITEESFDKLMNSLN